MTDEPLLVVPADWLAGLRLRPGFSPDYRTLLDHLDENIVQVLPRSQAEENPRFKQLIGYVIFRSGAHTYHYQRSRRAGEARLAGLRSVGIGGHVNATDAGNRVTPAALAAAIRREVAEEVALEAMPDIRYIGVINSNLGPVEQVHLGIVAVANLPAPIVTLRDPTLADGRFDPLPALTERLAEFETWSKLCIEALGDLTP